MGCIAARCRDAQICSFHATEALSIYYENKEEAVLSPLLYCIYCICFHLRYALACTSLRDNPAAQTAWKAHRRCGFPMKSASYLDNPGLYQTMERFSVIFETYPEKSCLCSNFIVF